MATVFREFSDTFEEFRQQFPDHLLTEELRNRMGRRDFPREEWMKEKITRMRRIMRPTWASGNPAEKDPDKSAS
jgi:hypothetical protein